MSPDSKNALATDGDELLRSIRTIRNIPRLKDIGFILVRHGLHGIASAIGAPLPVRLRGWLPGLSRSRVSQAAQLRMAFQDLGPIFIKLGQLIANRPDVFPPTVVDEFAKLQDRVDPLPFDAIRQVIEGELGGPLDTRFREVDPVPLASASLAQVHKAVTLDGQDVILKVQKPGIRKVIEHDLEILEIIAESLTRFEGLGRFDPAGIVAEVGRSLERELNFSFELNAIERTRVNFREDPVFVVPKTYRSLSTEKLLVLECFHGRSLRRVDRDALGPEECQRIARECSRILFEMIFRRRLLPR